MKPQLSVKEAAIEIGCTEADIRYYFSIGKLRNAFESKLIKYDRMVSLFDLFELPEMEYLHSLNTRSPKDCEEIQLYAEELIGIELQQKAPEYLYVFSEAFQRSASKPESEQPWTCVFADFKNDPVILLSYSEGRYQIKGIDVGHIVKYEDGIQILEPAIISREELDRFINIYGPVLLDSHTGLIVDGTAAKKVPSKPFQKPHPTNRAAEAICELGNKLTSTYKQIPSSGRLLNYMLSDEQRDFDVKEDPSGVYLIEEIRETVNNSV